MPNYRFRCKQCEHETDATMSIKELVVLQANGYNRRYDPCELCGHTKVAQVPVPFSFRMN